MPPLTVSGPGPGRWSHPVFVGRGLIGEVAELVADLPGIHSVAVVADERLAADPGRAIVAALSAPGRATTSHATTSHTFPSGEASKTRETKARIEDEILAAGHGRDALVVALGGGVALDLGGFIAATLHRGVPWIALPTTVLAMLDSSIGGKTAVDSPAGKNLIGAFHPPVGVLADLDRLATLPEQEYLCGFAEAVKHGLGCSADHFVDLERSAAAILARDPATQARIIEDSIRIKAGIVGADEREAGPREVLNLGHTVGHVLEQLSGYALPHGEAVARGLVAECRLAVGLGLLDPEVTERVRSLLKALGLPDEVFAGLPTSLQPAPRGGLEAERFLAVTRRDKKARAGEVRYVLPAALGRLARDPRHPAAWSRAVPDAAVRQHLFGGVV